MSNTRNESLFKVSNNSGSSDDTYVQTCSIVVAILISVIVTVSNFFVLVVILLKSELRQKHRLEFILWLCLSDIFVGFSGWMFVLNYLVAQLTTSAVYCSAMYHFIAAGIGLSLAHTFLICIDRFIAVVKNARFKQFHQKHRYRLIFGTCILVHLYIALLVGVYLSTDHISYCSLQAFTHSIEFLKGMSFLYMPFLILIPCLYTAVIIKFRNQCRRTQNGNTNLQSVFTTYSQNVRANTSQTAECQRRNYEKQVIVTTGLIILTFLIFTGPTAISMLVESLSLVTIDRRTRIFIFVLSYANSAINPVLYIWRIRRFKKEVCNIFCTRCK